MKKIVTTRTMVGAQRTTTRMAGKSSDTVGDPFQTSQVQLL